jgi:hemerythrin-like metal-binding protein
VMLDEGAIRMEVEDNGKGIDSERAPNRKSWGIVGMAERARHFGGDIAIVDTSHGTLVVLRLPLENPKKAGFAQLIWDDRFSSGNRAVDFQHMGLFDDSNKLLAAMLSDRSEDEMGTAVDALMRSLIRHFQDEEKLLMTVSYPHAAAHAVSHSALIQTAVEMVERFRIGKLDIGTLFKFLAHDLVAEHMLREDREFFPYLGSQPNLFRVSVADD